MSGNNVSTDQEFEKIKNAALEEAHEFLDKIPNWFNRNGDYIGRAKAFLDNIETANDIVGLSVCVQFFENFAKDFVNKEFSRLPVKAANTVANYVATDTVAGAIIGVAAAATGVAAATLAAGPVGAAVTGTMAGVCGVAKVYSNAKNKEKEEINQILEKVTQTRKDINEYDEKTQMQQKKERRNDKEKENDKQHTQNSQKGGNTTISITVKNDLRKPHKRKKVKHAEKSENSQVLGRKSVLRKPKNNQEDNEQTQTKNVEVQTEYEANIEKENEQKIIHAPTEARGNTAPRHINKLKNEQEAIDKQIILEENEKSTSTVHAPREPEADIELRNKARRMILVRAGINENENKNQLNKPFAKKKSVEEKQEQTSEKKQRI